MQSTVHGPPKSNPPRSRHAVPVHLVSSLSQSPDASSVWARLHCHIDVASSSSTAVSSGKTRPLIVVSCNLRRKQTMAVPHSHSLATPRRSRLRAPRSVLSCSMLSCSHAPCSICSRLQSVTAGACAVVSRRREASVAAAITCQLQMLLSSERPTRPLALTVWHPIYRALNRCSARRVTRQGTARLRG
ncbi:hypothetical protein BS50DRAFT_121413 [Corynespora cassiicola Philippines]|uniref:Uncharacterized protein n=1 Tax=Corynespora cassiicola Philippines TaxID=1448308 RepID=A0A2T2NAY8_CORCC|nr:hypothetical protein BS50DRAFT_121413 [Corynespora cassiicola Philippines]